MYYISLIVTFLTGFGFYLKDCSYDSYDGTRKDALGIYSRDYDAEVFIGIVNGQYKYFVTWHTWERNSDGIRIPETFKTHEVVTYDGEIAVTAVYKMIDIVTKH